ncbi:MAG TPA: four helix bundle suffix domain-containing protein [Candidatus Hydrogenedens sp.]|nr:four helix bundle suffix domain-containing protein [Candidatus Hydrogenedens sp.]
MVNSDGFIPAHGGYENLMSYQMSEIVFDATVYFCDRYIDKYSRTHDQMVQAARSGKQNIAEGCMASGVSKETEIKLIGVARASLEELLIDYKDFLRLRKLRLWDKNDRRVLAIRAIGRSKDRSYMSYRTYIEHPSEEVVVNTIVCLIHQTNYLLDQQIRKLEEQFIQEGGIRERMTRARLNERNKRK